MAFGFVTGVLLSVLLGLAPTASAADYGGPLIDAHSHLPNGTVIDAYVAAMKRHNVVKVVLLGVGGLQKDDTVWLTRRQNTPIGWWPACPCPTRPPTRRRASSKSSWSAGGRG
jgi:hypothetical protein